jgi:hypothetical protein
MITTIGACDRESVENACWQFWIFACVGAQDFGCLFKMRAAVVWPTRTHLSPPQLSEEPGSARTDAPDRVEGEAARIDHPSHVAAAVSGRCDADPGDCSLLVVDRLFQQMGVRSLVVRRLSARRLAGKSLPIRGFNLLRDGQAQLPADDISVALISTHRQLPFTSPRVRLDHSERCLLACWIGMEYRRPVCGGPGELNRGGAAKVREPDAGRIRPIRPRLLRQKLTLQRESILEGGAVPRALGGRPFQGRHCDGEVRLHCYA